MLRFEDVDLSNFAGQVLLLNSYCRKIARIFDFSWSSHLILLLSLVGGANPSSAGARSTMPKSDLSKTAPNSAPILITSPTSISMQETVEQAYNKLPEETDRANIFYLAAPENLNPGLYIPPSPPEPLSPESSPSESVIPEAITEESPIVPVWDIDGLTVNFSGDFTSFSQDNRFIEPTVTGILPNGDLVTFTTGLNTFAQPDASSVINIPVRTTWTRKMGDFTTTIGGGVDFFNQSPAAINFNASTLVPLGDQATLSFFIEHGPYKFNATTLNNQITSWRYGPNLYWQITPDLSFFSLVRWGRYNDGNREQQSFSRLENKFGNFSVAANLFNWRYRQDLEPTSGYFSPADFLVANAEIAWNGEVFDWLGCRLAASWGQQRLAGEWTSAYSYNSHCTFQVSETLAIDLGYAFSNVVSQTGGSAFNNRTISGQIRAQF